MATSEGLLWIPLESNPEVFNKWAERAGLSTSQNSFTDVYGLDPDLLALVPQPTKAVILLFPDIEVGQKRQKEEDARAGAEGRKQPHLDPTIFYVKQKISNACGTIALIHALANSEVTWSPGSALHNFIIDGQEKTPEERAELLQDKPLFSSIHAESAQEGQSTPRGDTDLHFTCFVSAPDAELRKIENGEEARGTSGGGETGMRLIELDGRRGGPIDHGICTDLLSDVASVARERFMNQTESLYFHLMALGPTVNE